MDESLVWSRRNPSTVSHRDGIIAPKPSQRWALVAGGAFCAFLLTACALVAGSLASRNNAAVSVAFLGNSLQYVNDLPRVMEALHGDGKLRQDSTFHGSVGLGSLFHKGNGMYNRWKSSTVNEDGFRDYGACTVTQLLLGYDDALSYPKDSQYDNDDDAVGDDTVSRVDDDDNFAYENDGMNPCFRDESYLTYATSIRASSMLSSSTASRRGSSVSLSSSSSSMQWLQWDYVVLNDQSLRPAIYAKRLRTAKSLLNDYVPLFLDTGATPILYMTWGYWRDDINMTKFVDVPTLTSLLYEGYMYYAQVLQEALPDNQQPRVAPIGLAFLVVWEENHAFWELLFADDQYHPTPLGTYLAACVVYATIHNRLPPASSRFTEDLFSRSRAMHLSGHQSQPLPTEEEAIYLRWIAERVVLEGYTPKSLVSVGDV